MEEKYLKEANRSKLVRISLFHVIPLTVYREFTEYFKGEATDKNLNPCDHK